MDGSFFDTLTRSLSTAGSRRGALGALLSGAFGLLGSRVGVVDAKDCKKIKDN